MHKVLIVMLLSIIFSKRPFERSNRTHMIERLHSRYASVLFDHCLRMLRDQGEAEDALQETFLLAHRSLSTFRYGTSHLPWLYRIATNTCLRTISKDKRGFMQTDSDAECVPNNAQGVHEVFVARDSLKKIADSLDERGQQILVGYYLSEMTQEEIATSLGISRRAVTKRLTALRAKFEYLFEGVSGNV